MFFKERNLPKYFIHDELIIEQMEKENATNGMIKIYAFF